MIIAPTRFAPAAALRLCVYCGSRDGARPEYEQAAQTVGRELGRRGWGLVYGGGKVGLMGTVADAALQAGAPVLGVIPDSLMQREVGHGSLTELVVVQTMHERKHIMAEQADAFLALPGGIGTLEELYEVWTWRHLGYHAKPVALLNTAGYYDALLDFTRRSLDEGFISQTQHDDLLVEDRIEPLLDLIAARASCPGVEDLSRI